MPTQDEIKQLMIWLDTKSEVPENIKSTILKILRVYKNLLKGSQKARQTLQRLREAMGISPKSERGRALQSQQKALLEMSEESKEYEELQKKRAELLKEKTQYDKRLKELKPRPKNPEQLEFDLASTTEAMFSHPLSDRHQSVEKPKVDKMKEFSKEKGLVGTKDKTKRMDLSVNVTEVTYEVETLTDPMTGKSVRASLIDIGPENFQLTWKAIANLIKMHVGFAIPINRIEAMIGQPEFSSSKICRVLNYVATNLLPLYLSLFEQLSAAKILSGDDTSTKVLEKNSENDEDGLNKQVEEYLGYVWPRADGKGDKKALNVSLLMGRSHEKDPRSTIRFFRTHLGSVGNLMTRLLEWREPKHGSLIFQGDLSNVNRLRSPHFSI